MRRTDIPATKSSLLRLKEHFSFVTSGHELLDQKREVLLEALMDIYREAGQLRRNVEAELATLYDGLRAALEAEALAGAGSQQIHGRERSIMGAIIPLLELESADPRGPAAAPGWGPTGAAYTRRRVRKLLPALVRLAEIEVSCRRLATELQKTQRKVNALESIFIPEYRDTIHFIEASLEEKEREALFQLKRLKGRRQGSQGDAES